MNRSIAAALSMVMLSACVSLVPEPETPNALYRLGPVEADQTLMLNRSVLVRQPEALRVFSGVDIVARDEGGAIRLVQGAEWADRAPRLMQLTLLDYLGSQGGSAAVLPETGARADYELSWRISEFALEGRTAIARAELTLLDGRTRKPVQQKTVSSQIEARDNEMASRASALAEAGRDIVRKSGKFLAEATQDPR